MFSYTAYGLGIHSLLPLPELTVGPGEASQDIVIQLGPPKWEPADAMHGSWTCAGRRETYLSWPEVGKFSVRNGREIVIDPAISVDERILRLFVLGPALAVLLQQRGMLVVHGSAVAIQRETAQSGGSHREAAAFLGHSGWGKSTMAAALHTQGHELLADDLLAVRVSREGATVFPGIPELKLWPATAAALGEDAALLPRVHPQREKRTHRAASGLGNEPLPLRHIYVLTPEGARETQTTEGSARTDGITERIEERARQGHHIEPLQPREAFVELLRHSYCGPLVQAMGGSLHFLQCAMLSRSARVRRLHRRGSLRDLPAVAQHVREDCARGESCA